MTSLIDVAIANCRLLYRDQTLTVVCHTRLSHPESAAIRYRPPPNQRQLDRTPWYVNTAKTGRCGL